MCVLESAQSYTGSEVAGSICSSQLVDIAWLENLSVKSV